MDKFLTGLPPKRKAEDELSTDVLPKQGKEKTRKYDETYLAFGFTCTTVGNEERPQCVVCLKILACDSLKPKAQLGDNTPRAQSQLTFSEKKS